MFNLFHSQGKAQKYLLGGLLVMVAMSMLLYLVPNYDTGQSGTDQATVLQVGKTKWTAQDAERRYQAYAKGRLPEGMMAVYFPQFLEESKQRLAAIEEARRLGIAPSDEEVFEVIAGTPGFAQYFEGGKLVKRAEFESALAQQGFTIQDVYDDLRDQLSLVRMQDAIVDSTIVTDDEIKAEYKRKHDRISIDWIAFTEAQMQSRVKITEADIEKTYNQGRQLYTQPEKFSYRALLLTKDKVDAGIAVSEQELRNAYNAALDNFRTPEKIHVRHILLSTDNKSDDEKKKLKAKAEDLVKQARGGADFAELAKKNSDDSGNASNGGDLGTFPRGQMVKPFEDAAFALKPKEVSGVVTTQFGYHIIQVIDKEQSTVTPFENVRPDLERELRSSRSFDALQNAAVKLRADVLKNPSAAADVAKTDNAELITMTDAAQSQEIPTVGVAPEVTAVLPSLKAGAVSDVIHLANDRVVVIVMDKRIPSRPSTLEEARADIVKTLNATAGRKLLDETAKEAADRLKKGEDLRAVAKALGGTVESASDVAMPDNVPGIGQAVSLQEAFKHKAGDIVGPSVIQNRTLVIKVLAKSDADMAGLAGERTQIVNSLRSARAGLNNRLWMDSVVKKMTDSGDITINEEEMKRVMERFRS